jgi:glucose/arabinose dehydrogenase
VPRVPRIGRSLLALALLALWLPASASGRAAYTVPADNPFVGTPGAAPEVYVYGLRNPFRWSFDRQSGDMIIGDVGGALREEIDFLPRGNIAGANLGWNCFEGNVAGPGGCSVAGARGPVHEYPNGTGPDAVTGGYVVRDPALPSFLGRYLFADFYDGDVLSMTLAPPSAPVSTGLNVPHLAAFGENGVGRLHVVSLDGPVSRLTDTGGALATELVANFDQPVAVAGPPGDAGRLFVAEIAGRVMLRAGGTTREFLDLTGLVESGGERGLLALAPAPDYASSGRLYVFYTAVGGDLQLDEFRRSAGDPNRGDPATRRPLLTIEHSAAANHNGGQLLFGPDRRLYLSTGDGGGQGDPEGDAQNLGSRLGKVLRIDPRPPAPAPATGAPADTRPPRFHTKTRRRQRVLRLGGVVVYARCPAEPCRVSMNARLRIGRLSYPLRRVRRTLQPNRRTRLRARLRRRARRALRMALRDRTRARVDVGLRARDAAGNGTSLRRVTVRVRRR